MTQDQKLSSGSNQQDTTETETGSENQNNYPELTLEEVAAIAPVNRNGVPDLFNHMPTRLIPLEEAKYRKWPYFFQSTPCRYGHVAPRYTSNFRLCVDCNRLKRSKTTIGEKTGVDNKNFPGRGGAFGKGITVKVEKKQEVDAWERKFLEAYAYHKDFKAACEALNLKESQVNARIAFSSIFKEAMDNLDARIGKQNALNPEKFIWTDAKYDKLIEVYINTGELATARDTIGVTPFEYFTEIGRNHVFSERIREAEPLAHLALEERAIQLALAGNDKLLTKVLSVKKPEYNQPAKVEMNVTEKLDDRQIAARLFRLLDKLRPSVIEGTVVEVIPNRSNAVIGALDGAGQEEESEDDRPLLQQSRN